MKSDQEPTEARLEQKARFLEAAARADKALEDPATRAFYAKIAKQRKKITRNVAIGEYLCIPSFKPLGLSSYKGAIGDTIVIRARDSIGLVDVNVDIRSQDGALIEQGKAVEDGFRSGLWAYTATASAALGSDVFIEVVGFNHAGTMAKRTENPTVGVEE